MKWEILYRLKSLPERTVLMTENLNPGKPCYEVMADNSEEAIHKAKKYMAAILQYSGIIAEITDSGIMAYENSHRILLEEYYEFSAVRLYDLIGKDGKVFKSCEPGTLGGHKKLKIYGRLDCPSAAKYIAKGQYVRHRVFFADQETAIAAGYRPCAVCMKKEYKQWKAEREKQKQKEME